MKLNLTFIILIITYFTCLSQCHPKLNQYAIGFNTIKADAFSFLDNTFNDVRIIGYGEDTHGTAEFTILASELIKYLSEKQGFKLFILETGFGDGQYLNDYIQGKNNDLKFIMNNRNPTWRYRTQEFYQMMNDLKAYNQNNADKIYIYGCEMQYVVSDIQRIKVYLKLVDSDYKMEGFEKYDLWHNFQENEKTDYFIAYAKLKKYFINNYDDFKNKTSENEFNLAYHQVEVLGQFVTTINQNNYQRKADFRDIYMAENIQWILNFHGEQSKALYWAHNAHVGDWVSNGIVDVTGHQLRKIYGDSYFNIATDFGSGEYIAYPSDAEQTGNWRFETFSHKAPLINTFSYCLKEMGKPNVFLNFRKAKTDQDLKVFLETDLTTMSGAGARASNYNTDTSDLGKAFDGIIFLNKTHKITWEE
jgi:erythromycin esterase